MCYELEAVGLNHPEYYINDFMLQVVIFNAKHQSFDIKKINLGSQKGQLAINDEKPGFIDEKLAIHNEKPGFTNKKQAIEKLLLLLNNQNYSYKTKAYILKIYETIDHNQIFGAPEVEKIIGCSASSSKEIMKKIKDLKIVDQVNGKGKGKYTFKR